ncbi:MAG TPA: ROK family protein [Anaerolineae bacterium]|nr:ROK family protein [Anaerolineae bacterium]
MTQKPLVGGIEAGGTKFVCAIGTGPDDIRAEIRFPTTTPSDTLAQAITFFQEQQNEHGPLAALGVAAFGPLDPHPQSPTYGYITTTPKPQWKNTDVVGPLHQSLNLPITFDTDVNGAALGEYRWGAGQNLDTFIYITIGTGIGGGIIANGQLIHGLIHPELGHMRLPLAPDDTYSGHCPFHGHCFEGLAAGPAIADRWQTPGDQLPPNHPAWELEAHYIATALHNLICIISPQRIILGGGVMNQQHLFPLIQAKTKQLLNTYIASPAVQKNIADYIVPPALGNQAGVAGAFALAHNHLQ